MTVSNTTTKLTYNGDGANRTFGVTFPLLSANHLRIVVTASDGTEQEITANFSLDPALEVLTYPTLQSGLAPVPVGSKITLIRQTPQTQEIDLKSGNIMDAGALERGYDKLTYLVQEIQESVGRALKCKVSETSEHTAEEFLSEITEAATEAKDAAQTAAACADAAQNAAGEAAEQNTLAGAYAGQAANAAENAAQQANNAEQYKVAAEDFSDQASAAKAAAEASKEAAEAAAVSASSAIAQAISTHNTSADAHEDIRQGLSGKQDQLTAGTNITIENGVISAQSAAAVTVDAALSAESENPVQNKVIKAALDTKQNTLTAGANITIEDGIISATGGGSEGTIDVDGSLSATSENPVQNKVIKAALDAKQNTLTAGANITIEDGIISAQSAAAVTVDAALSAESENPVQNKVIKAALAEKQAALTAGTNITIENGVISASFDTSELLSKSERGAAGGVASLDTQSKVPATQLPDLSETYLLAAKKGAAGGVAELDAAGKVPAARLPVDGSSITVGEDGKLKAVGGGSGGGHALGDLVWNSSSLAVDNPGRLPLFTGETIANFDNLYPDLYEWLLNHTEMTCTDEEYEEILAQYGECCFYALTTEDVYGPGINIATRENAISSGEANFQSGYLNYPFDGEAAGPNGTNYWSARGQGDYGNTFVGCYLGNINLTQKVTTIKMAQGIWASSGVSSVKVQYSPDNGTTWQDLETYETPLQANYGDYNVLELPDYTPAATYGLRVMVEAEPANIRSWWVYELQFLTAGVKTGETIKVRLPLVRNYVKAANTADGIKNIEAGLPDHTHELYVSDGYGNDGGNTKNQTGYIRNAVYKSQTGTSWVKNSSVYGKSDTVTPASTTLYPWVVAFNAAVEASVAQAAEFQQALSGKADANLGNVAGNIDYVVDSYSDESGNWYRLYKSGWIEQGGKTDQVTGNPQQAFQVTLLKPMLNTNYTLLANNQYVSGSSSTVGNAVVISETSVRFTCESIPNSASSTQFVRWYVCGQAAN